MGYLEFTRINTTELRIPIKVEMCKCSSRALPTKQTQRVYYDLEVLFGLGFSRGTPFFIRHVEDGPIDSLFSVDHRYYLKNGNYIQVLSNGLLVWKWGNDFKTITMGTELTAERIGVPSTNKELEVYFLINATGCYRFYVYKYTVDPEDYPSGYRVEIEFFDLTSLDNHNIPYVEGIREFFYGESLFEEDISKVEGGEGNFSNLSDSVSLPSIPLISPLDCGMFSMYAPTKQQLNEFSNYLWSSSIFDNLPKLFQDPMEAILNLSIIPVEFPVTESSNIILGNLDSGVNSLKISQQFFEIDFGTINLNEYWGNALDYDNTEIDIYLPFIGFQKMDIKDVMNCIIKLIYRIDLLSGVCVAYIMVARENTNSLLYQWKGNCSLSIPLTARNFSQKMSTLIGVGASLIGGAAAMSNPTTAGIGLLALSSAPAIATQQKVSVQKIGSFQMESSYFGVWTPYIIITRPKQSYAQGYSHFKGFPSNITSIISDVSGYSEVESVHLENITATSEELTEIENILKSGFII